MAKNMIDVLETQEQIDILMNAGYGKLVETFLLNETKVYTKKGRLNKSGALRELDCKAKELEDALKACRELLGEEDED